MQTDILTDIQTDIQTYIQTDPFSLSFALSVLGEVSKFTNLTFRVLGPLRNEKICEVMRVKVR